MTRILLEERLFLTGVAERVQRISPAWVEIGAAHGELTISARGKPQVKVMGRVDRITDSSLNQVERGDVEVLTARNLLDTLQDVVTRLSGETWPPTATHGRSHLAEAHASVVGDVLNMWYGPVDEPVLAAEAMPLTGMFLRPFPG